MKSLSAVLREAFPTARFEGIPIDEIRFGCVDSWDSLGNVNLLMLVEQTYGIRFDAEQLSEVKSLTDIWRVVTSLRSDVPLD